MLDFEFCFLRNVPLLDIKSARNLQFTPHIPRLRLSRVCGHALMESHLRRVPRKNHTQTGVRKPISPSRLPKPMTRHVSVVQMLSFFLLSFKSFLSFLPFLSYLFCISWLFSSFFSSSLFLFFEFYILSFSLFHFFTFSYILSIRFFR